VLAWYSLPAVGKHLNKGFELNYYYYYYGAMAFRLALAAFSVS
jgi:hypothetical protein